MTQNLSCAAVPRWRGDDGHSPLVVTRPAAHGAPRSVVRLFVPWGSFTYMTPHPLQCPAVTCELTNAKSDIANVDAYVVDSNGAYITEHYDWVRNPLRKVLVAFNTENIEGRRVGLRKGYGIRYLAKPWNATWWRHFHVVASYHTGAHVVVNFFHWSLCRDSSFVAGYRHWETAGKRRSAAAGGIAGGAPRGVLAAKTRRGASVLFFVRNCDFAAHRRAGFMRRLQQHIAIDSVGKCENNRQQEEVRACSGLATNRRSCIIADYRFYLAIENSISLDYVSEKVYEALLVGTIPIYLGAPNAADFMPARHSAIMARDFASLAQLAAYVRCIEGNRSLYEYYTAWHTRPLLPRFAAEIAGGAGRDAPLCQVCSAVAAARARVAEKRVKERDAAADGAATADGAGGTLAMREAVLAQFDDDATWRSRRVPGVSEELWDLENSQAPLAQCLVGV